jgi:hypothetical protein
MPGALAQIRDFNMETFLIFSLAVVIGTYLLSLFQKRLTKWDKIVKLYSSPNEPEGEIIYGANSEFNSSLTKYPLINTIVKFILCAEGLYVKYELFFEWPKYYKPVLIPWDHIFILTTGELGKDGYDKYQIYYDNVYQGQIKIQQYISKDILKFIEKNNFITRN